MRMRVFAASKIDELFASLNKQSADVYVQRSQRLYAVSRMRTKLATWSMDDLELVALADPAYHGRDNALKHLRDIDSERSVQSEVIGIL